MTKKYWGMIATTEKKNCDHSSPTVKTMQGRIRGMTDNKRVLMPQRAGIDSMVSKGNQRSQIGRQMIEWLVPSGTCNAAEWSSMNDRMAVQKVH